MTIQIDGARADDVPSMVELLAALFAIEADFTSDRDRQERGLRLLLDEPRAAVVVARDGARVVGMATAQLVISTAEGGPAMWIEDVVVTPDRRGRGIGRLLLDELLSWGRARGVCRAQLQVDEGNDAGRRFYARLGWGRTHLRSLHLWPGA